MVKGGIDLQMKSWAVTLGLGAAAGAVAVMMLPKQSTTRRLVNKAAGKVEDAVHQVTNKVTREMDM